MAHTSGKPEVTRMHSTGGCDAEAGLKQDSLVFRPQTPEYLLAHAHVHPSESEVERSSRRVEYHHPSHCHVPENGLNILHYQLPIPEMV